MKQRLPMAQRTALTVGSTDADCPAAPSQITSVTKSQVVISYVPACYSTAHRISAIAVCISASAVRSRNCFHQVYSEYQPGKSPGTELPLVGEGGRGGQPGARAIVFQCENYYLEGLVF